MELSSEWRESPERCSTVAVDAEKSMRRTEATPDRRHKCPHCQLCHPPPSESAPEIARFFSTTLFIALDDDDDHQTLCTLRPPSFVPRIFFLLSSLSYRHWRVRLLTYYTSLTFHLCPKPYRSSHPVRPSNYPSVPQASYPSYPEKFGLIEFVQRWVIAQSAPLYILSHCRPFQKSRQSRPLPHRRLLAWDYDGANVVYIMLPDVIIAITVSYLNGCPEVDFSIQAFIDVVDVLRSSSSTSFKIYLHAVDISITGSCATPEYTGPPPSVSYLYVFRARKVLSTLFRCPQ